MWFLNGPLAEDELKRQIGAMAAGGVGGVQVAARTGLDTPYLSERWFHSIELIQDAAEQHGLAVWLADEYPYPSGASGGEVVLRHPEYRAWHMQADRVRAAPGEEVRLVAPGTSVLRACGVPLRGGVARWEEATDLEAHVGWIQHEHLLFEPSRVYLTTRRYMTNAPRPTLSWRAPSGADAWEIWLVAAAEVTDYKFFGSYVDLCNADACRLFLATTYERYLSRLGPERFSRLVGFFLDEAHPQNWSWRLPEFFRQRRGYDLLDVLPALWTEIGPATARVRYDYRQSLTELFDESFMRPVAQWCERHDVQLSLEVPSTRNVVQRHASVPGIDPGHDKVGVALDDVLARELPNFRGNLGFPASLAAQTGRTRVLDELFHSVGWSLTLQDMKAMLDRAAARGANLFALHAFCYTIGGLRKWDAPPSEFDQNPYWPYFRVLADYAARLAFALSRGRRVAPIALLDPITSLWAHTSLAGLQQDEIGRRVAREWTSIMRELIAAQRSHDNLDPTLLAEAHVDRGHLRIGDADYVLVVMPSMTNLEQIAWTKLEEFVASGGTVIACGSLPDEDIEPASAVLSRCRAAFGQAGQSGFQRVDSVAELLQRLEECVPADLQLIPNDNEQARRDFLVAHRRDAEDDLFLIANSSMQEHHCELAVRSSGSTILRLDLETGRMEPLEAWRGADDRLRVRVEFSRYGSELLLVTRDVRREPAARTPPAAPVLDVEMDGDWRCEVAGEGMNALRLERFRFTLGDDAEPDDVRWPPRAVVVEPKPLVNILQDCLLAGTEWPGRLRVEPIFGASPRIRLQLPASAWYAATFTVEALPRRAVLCIEDLALAGEWQVWVNQRAVPRDAFVPFRRWTVDNREADLAPLLQQGPNEVLVRVRVSRQSDGLLDAVYVLGDFGVFHDQAGAPVLGEYPAALRWAARHATGYPYFCGTFRLSRSVSLDVPAGAFRLRLSEEELMFAGVVEVAIDGHSLGVRAWAPFVWDVPAGLVRPGGTSGLTVLVTTTLVEQLEGKRYDRHRRELVPVAGAPLRIPGSIFS